MDPGPRGAQHAGIGRIVDGDYDADEPFDPLNGISPRSQQHVDEYHKRHTEMYKLKGTWDGPGGMASRHKQYDKINREMYAGSRSARDAAVQV